MFVGNPGSESYIDRATILVSGPTIAITATNQEGKYAFDSLPPGTYAVEATFETLKTKLSVDLDANRVIELPIQLKLPEDAPGFGFASDLVTSRMAVETIDVFSVKVMSYRDRAEYNKFAVAIFSSVAVDQHLLTTMVPEEPAIV